MHSAQSCALFLGGKIRYFEIESGGTFCKIHTVMFIFHDYVIVPTTLNIKQVKSQGGNSKPRGGLYTPPPSQINPWVSFCLKAGFFSGLKTRCSNSQQILNQAFLAVFTAVPQLKNTKVGLSGLQEMCISSFETCTCVNENEEQSKGFAGSIFKSDVTERL